MKKKKKRTDSSIYTIQHRWTNPPTTVSERIKAVLSEGGHPCIAFWAVHQELVDIRIAFGQFDFVDWIGSKQNDVTT